MDEGYNSSIFTGDNSRSLIMRLKNVFLTLINFAMTLADSQGLLVMKMCGVYNRYGQVFQFSGWQKYSHIWILNTMGKTVSKYIPDCNKRYFYFLISACSASVRCSIYWVFLCMALIVRWEICCVGSFTIVHEHLSIACTRGSRSLNC